MASNKFASSISPTFAFAGSVVAAAVWFTALLTIPGFQSSGLSVIVARVIVHVITLGGIWAGLSLTSLTVSQRSTTWLAISVPFTIWHGAAWAIVARGLLQPGVLTVPLLPIMIVVPTSIVLMLVLRSRRIGMLLDATPVSWLVGLQFYRVIGAVFIANWVVGLTPGAFAWPAGTGDVITGLMALPTAVTLAARKPGSGRAGLFWNLFGMTDLIVALVLGALTSPGPLQHLSFDHPNLTIGTYPAAIIPAFTVPSSLVLHALSLRQLLRRRRAIAPVAA